MFITVENVKFKFLKVISKHCQTQKFAEPCARVIHRSNEMTANNLTKKKSSGMAPTFAVGK